MTELELVQTTLANLPRPTPPPRLRRAIMAQVTAEARAEAAASLVQSWSRAEENGKTVEWRQYGPAPTPASPPDQASPMRATFTQWRHQEGTRVTIHQTLRTH